MNSYKGHEPNGRNQKKKLSLKSLIPQIKLFFARLFYIVGLVWETKPIFLIAMALLCLFDGVLPVVGALISKELMNEIAALIESDLVKDTLGNSFSAFASAFVNDLKPVFMLLIFQLVYQFSRRIISGISSSVNAVAGELVVNHIKLKIMNKAKDVDIASFDSPDFYEKLENANREAGMRPLMILRATFNVISSVISAVSFVIVLATLHPLAPVLIVLMALPGAIINYRYRNHNFRYMRWHSKERRQMQYFSSAVSDKDKAKEIRIMGLADELIGKYKTAFVKYFKGLKKIIIKEQVYQTAVSTLTIIADCVLFMYVAYTVIYNNGLIGDYSLYTGALTSIMSLVGTIITSTATIYEGTLFIDNMMVFMREEIKVVPNVKIPLIPKENQAHTIEFRNVTFRYPGTDRDVIKNVNLSIRTGETVLLVGLNGAGKTTLIKLLTRLYDPTDGIILLDGVDIRSYDVKALYDLYGIIFQDYVKYAVTVRENIAYGDIKSGIDEEKIKQAAQSSDADSFIKKLPNEYDTPLMRFFEDNGIELSIGQWQKLSIARAYYKKSDIMILDEPTASLDPLAEQEVFDSFTELSEGKLTLLVSHRLSSATTASKIIVMEDGCVVETGTHDELIAKGGKYALLFNTQAKHYISPVKRRVQSVE